jgi:NitT/TauT family transport system substrate-binding protein
MIIKRARALAADDDSGSPTPAKENPMPRFCSTILVLLAAAAAVATGASCKPRKEGTAAMTKLSVGVSALRISLPVFVAAERGLFARHGLDVKLEPYVTAQPMVDDVILGKVDAAGYAAYPIVFASSKGAARAPRMVTAIVEDAQHRLSYGLAKPGSGLRFPEGARGRRVGILPTVAYRRWLEAILRAAGIQPAEVTVVPVMPPMQASALADGGVDLLFTNDPMATAALASGKAELVDDGPPCAARLGSPFPFGGFVLAGAFADEKPEVAARLVAALDEAIAEVRRDPAGARAAMAKHVRPEEAAWVDRYPDARFLTSAEVPAGWLADEVAHEKKLGILDADPVVGVWPPHPGSAPGSAPSTAK